MLSATDERSQSRLFERIPYLTHSAAAGGGAGFLYDVVVSLTSETDTSDPDANQEQENPVTTLQSSCTNGDNTKACWTVETDENGKTSLVLHDDDGTFEYEGVTYECTNLDCKPVEDTEDNSDDDETEQPCLDNCTSIPPEGWYQTYASNLVNPLIQYWGDLAPYIICGPDGCTSSALLRSIDGHTENDLGPLTNCSGNETGGACADDQLATYCTRFNWPDTFTDPPENPDPGIDTCTDPSQPCPETCADSSQPCPDNL